ncbi:MAG: McrB family protein [Gemmataceae bacterium]
MVKVWKIAPGDKARVWKETHEQGCITINWLNQTDFKKLLKKHKSPEDRKKALRETDGVGNRTSVDSILYFVEDIQPGDTIVANKGRSCVVGIGVVDSDYLPPNDPRNPRKKTKEHRHARLVKWEIDKRVDFPEFVFHPNQPPTVQLLDDPKQRRKIKQAYLKEYPELKDKLDELIPDEVTPPPNDGRGTTMKTLLEQFRQIIAYGPPGTGKTREAKRVALAMLSGKDFDENSTDDEIEEELKGYENRYDLVVFHPAYEYEQFVGGIEPTPTEGQHLTFETKPGVFLRLCRRAEQNKSASCVLIIDEINRGNLPKLLGELVYALEYRGHEVTLPFEYGGSRTFRIPKNLYIIATMNSADRSIGHIDVAIRRRFALFPLGPNAQVVRDFWRDIGDEGCGRRLAELMDKMNADLKKVQEASGEAELGVGHSYFLPKRESSFEEAKQQVKMKLLYQVRPLLRVYAELLSRESDLQKCFASLDEVIAQL